MNREILVDLETAARAAYDEPHRKYHDAEHLRDCLARLAAVDALGDAERRRLRWALIWHDAVYDPSRGDNEERSARRARRDLEKADVPEEDIAEVERLILLTRDHRAAMRDRTGGVMTSIDLSILGSPPDRYDRYVEQVRREYRHVPDTAWKSGRTRVLRSLLKVGRLYPAPEFSGLEQPARANMRRELSRLSGG